MENQIQELIENPKENLKIKYKNQRLEEAKQVYLCQCEKVYLSFPALYLHVRNKHKVKLTTKITDKICKMEERNGKTYITYFLIPQQEIEEKKDDSYNSEQARKSSKNEALKTSDAEIQEPYYFKFQNYGEYGNNIINEDYNNLCIFQIKNVINDYLRDLANENAFLYHNSAILLSHFLEYIKILSHNSKQFDQYRNFLSTLIVNNLPLFFNQFIVYYLPTYISGEYHQYTEKKVQKQIMRNFGNWLRQKQYSNLIIFLLG